MLCTLKKEKGLILKNLSFSILGIKFCCYLLNNDKIFIYSKYMKYFFRKL